MLNVTLKPILPGIDILLPGIEEHILIYDRIQLFRSPDNITYTEITAPLETSASILGTVSGPFALSNKTLTIQKEGFSWSVSFTGTLDTLSVIKEINTQIKIPLFSNKTNHLLAKSDVIGTGSWIQFGGNAAPILGLTTTKTYGFAERPYLTVPTTIYRIYDLSDTTNAWYKIRLYSSKSGRTSGYSDAVQYPVVRLIDGSNFVSGSMVLSDALGFPIKNSRVIVTPIMYKNVSGVSILNSYEQKEFYTDNFGALSISLIKGSLIRVDIEGSALSREMTVPNQDFNILTVLSTYPDPMNISPAPALPIISS
jgi:hypothetical protein